MTHTCYNCNRPTGADYRIVGFDIGPDGIPVNLAFCADCRARGVVLATAETGANLGELPPAQTAQLGMWGAP